MRVPPGALICLLGSYSAMVLIYRSHTCKCIPIDFYYDCLSKLLKLRVASTYIHILPTGRVGRHIVFPFAPICLSVTKSCPLYNLKTVRGITTKLHTFVKHIMHKIITLLWIFLEFFPFDHLQCYFVSALLLDNR